MPTPQEVLDNVAARIDSYGLLPWTKPPAQLLTAYGNLAAAVELDKVTRELLQIRRILEAADFD